jgi:hypothetical protein
MLVAGREDLQRREDQRADHAHGQARPRELQMALAEHVVGAQRREHEGACNGRAAHVVGVLPRQPGVGQQVAEGIQLRAAVLDGVAHRVLHPRVRGDDEEARDPRAGEDHQRRHPVQPLPDARCAGEEDPQEGRLGEEGEHALQRERLADDAPRVVRERGPVRAELELHRDPGHDPDGEVHREDLRPEVRRRIVGLALLGRLAQRPQPPGLAAEECDGLQPGDEERQAHREDREQLVERDGQRELPPVHRDVAAHVISLAARLRVMKL